MTSRRRQRFRLRRARRIPAPTRATSTRLASALPIRRSRRWRRSRLSLRSALRRSNTGPARQGPSRRGRSQAKPGLSRSRASSRRVRQTCRRATAIPRAVEAQEQAEVPVAGEEGPAEVALAAAPRHASGAGTGRTTAVAASGAASRTDRSLATAARGRPLPRHLPPARSAPATISSCACARRCRRRWPRRRARSCHCFRFPRSGNPVHRRGSSSPVATPRRLTRTACVRATVVAALAPAAGRAEEVPVAGQAAASRARRSTIASTASAFPAAWPATTGRRCTASASMTRPDRSACRLDGRT